MSEPLTKLRELTEKLPPFPASVGGNDYSREYKMDEGTTFCAFLWEEPRVGVHRWYSSVGCKFPEHTHAEKEYICVYEGRMEVTFEETGMEIVEGSEIIYISPFRKHSAYFPLDTKYITIMIPPSKDFPRGGVTNHG